MVFIDLREVECLPSEQYTPPRDIVSLTKSPSVNTVSGNANFFKAIMDTGQELKLNAVNICDSRYHGGSTGILHMKNFSTPEIRLHEIWPIAFTRNIMKAHKHNKLK